MLLWGNKSSRETNLSHRILSYNMYEHLSSTVNGLEKGHNGQEPAVKQSQNKTQKVHTYLQPLCAEQWIRIEVGHM
jgi:hypothetical protein